MIWQDVLRCNKNGGLWEVSGQSIIITFRQDSWTRWQGVFRWELLRIDMEQNFPNSKSGLRSKLWWFKKIKNLHYFNRKKTKQKKLNFLVTGSNNFSVLKTFFFFLNNFSWKYLFPLKSGVKHLMEMKKNPLTNNSQKQENRFFSTRIFCYLVSAIQPTNTDNHSHKTQLDLFRIGLKNFRKYLKITQKVGWGFKINRIELLSLLMTFLNEIYKPTVILTQWERKKLKFSK